MLPARGSSCGLLGVIPCKGDRSKYCASHSVITWQQWQTLCFCLPSCWVATLAVLGVSCPAGSLAAQASLWACPCFFFVCLLADLHLTALPLSSTPHAWLFQQQCAEERFCYDPAASLILVSSAKLTTMPYRCISAELEPAPCPRNWQAGQSACCF